MGRGVVYEGRNFALAHLAGAEAEDEEQGVNDVGFARSIRPDNGGERGVKRPNLLAPRVTLEIAKYEVGHDEAVFGTRDFVNGSGSWSETGIVCKALEQVYLIRTGVCTYGVR